MRDLSDFADLQSQIPPLLYIGKGMRVCDLQVYFEQYSASAVERAMEEMVKSGKAIKYKHGDQTFYMLRDVKSS